MKESESESKWLLERGLNLVKECELWMLVWLMYAEDVYLMAGNEDMLNVVVCAFVEACRRGKPVVNTAKSNGC